jgi:hypothetical protein
MVILYRLLDGYKIFDYQIKAQKNIHLSFFIHHRFYLWLNLCINNINIYIIYNLCKYSIDA